MAIPRPSVVGSPSSGRCWFVASPFSLLLFEETMVENRNLRITGKDDDYLVPFDHITVGNKVKLVIDPPRSPCSSPSWTLIVEGVTKPESLSLLRACSVWHKKDPQTSLVVASVSIPQQLAIVSNKWDYGGDRGKDIG